jgi:hypothetical protein
VFSICVTSAFGGSQSHAGGTSHGRAELVLEDSATDEVFTGEVLAGRAAVSGGAQLSAVKTVFRALKNVFEPMLLRPAAVPTRIPAQASRPGLTPPAWRTLPRGDLGNSRHGDVVWVTEKGDSRDPFTQDDAEGISRSKITAVEVGCLSNRWLD